jgi:hypothetical protein
MCSISGLRNVAQYAATTGRESGEAINAQRSTLNVQRSTMKSGESSSPLSDNQTVWPLGELDGKK